MHLGVALSRLDDLDNACAAYDKALDSSSRGWARAFGPATVSWPGRWATTAAIAASFGHLLTTQTHIPDTRYALLDVKAAPLHPLPRKVHLTRS